MRESGERDDGVGAAIVQVVEDAKSYAAAQALLYRETLLARWRAARTGVLCGAVAAVLALAALIALLVGLIVSLTPLVGPWLGTLIVVGVTLALAAILGRFAAARLSDALGPVE